MALAWIYLKTFGQITEPLCDELFWVFTKEDFKHALACFIFDDGENHEAKMLVKNIKMRFDKFFSSPAKRPRSRKRGATQSSANLLGAPEYNGTISDWVKEMYSKVNLGGYFLKIQISNRIILNIP